jgi:hypothetical protein
MVMVIVLGDDDRDLYGKHLFLLQQKSCHCGKGSATDPSTKKPKIKTKINTNFAPRSPNSQSAVNLEYTGGMDLKKLLTQFAEADAEARADASAAATRCSSTTGSKQSGRSGG